MNHESWKKHHGNTDNTGKQKGNKMKQTKKCSSRWPCKLFRCNGIELVVQNQWSTGDLRTRSASTLFLKWTLCKVAKFHELQSSKQAKSIKKKNKISEMYLRCLQKLWIRHLSWFSILTSEKVSAQV